MPFKKLPIGIEDFRKMMSKGCYYVDKTLLMKELLDKGGEVSLFTQVLT
ncbi:AAA family ATPase [Lachnospiraceae bacterium ZAX-1]